MMFARWFWQRAIRILGCGIALVAWEQPARAGDPMLEWFTLDAGQFRIHYHGGLERMAQRAAHLAAQFEAEIEKLIGPRPSERTEIVLADYWDDANGVTSALPYSRIVLRVTAPDDMSTLGYYDDWLTTLMLHEGTHAVHVNHIAGLPALYNAILGKQAVPVALQPSWLKEGLAVYAESRLTAGGRLRSPAFDMMFRADLLENEFASLDQITGSPMRWPWGLEYLYGAKFVEFLSGLYGPTIFKAVAEDSSDDVIPFAVSRPFYRATGRTIEQLYDAFRQSSERRVREQLEPVVARGLREGRRLTHHGRTVSYPRRVPAHCRRASSSPLGSEPRAKNAAREASLIYFRDDGHERAGYYELSFGLDASARQSSELLVARASGDVAALGPDCSLWFESTAPSRRLHSLRDLFRQLPGETSPSGLEASRVRVTTGRRAADPDISPDGTELVYVTNRAGTTTLRIASVSATGGLADERILVPSAVSEQVFTPRFSPDGRLVAYSVWTRGGYRDLRIVDLASGEVRQYWRDRATDQQPVFSPDGRWLFFSSDRGGISNIHAFDLARKRRWQVTNVQTGAYMPELSEDGRTLYYVGYGSRGFDLFAMPIDERDFLEPMADSAPPDDAVAFADRGEFPVTRYSALPTLRPRALTVEYKNQGSGQSLLLSTRGGDVVGLHFVDATAVFEPEGSSPDLYFNYHYSRLPYSLYVQASRIVDPSNYYRYGSFGSSIDEIRTGVTTGIAYAIPGEFDHHVASLSYHVQDVDSVLPAGVHADPYATVPVVPRRGIASGVRLSYSYGNAEGSWYGLGAERGLRLQLVVDESHRALGSELEGTTTLAELKGYVLMPWLRHHVLALAGVAAASTGNAGVGYSLGGYQYSPILTSIINGSEQSRWSLRGYPSGRFRGRRFLLGQAEYRFPILVIDRGVSTLPLFLTRFGGALGVDAGSAFNDFDPHAFDETIHFGYAGELWFDLFLAYGLAPRLVLGYAAGKGEGAYEGGTGYLVLSSGL